MKQLFTFLLFACLLASRAATAKQIDEATARATGYRFLNAQAGLSPLRSADALSLVSKATDGTNTCYYIFNTGTHGFIIVAGDDIVYPVIGYSDESAFDVLHPSPEVIGWLRKYRDAIAYAINRQIPASPGVAAKWAALSGSVAGRKATKITGTALSPLLTARWDQAPFYNALCPYDTTYQATTLTGCVATAMGQIMKYWNYPATGTGTHSFTLPGHPAFGTMSADFGATTYQWAQMPDTIHSANAAIATLLYQAGVSVDMQYGALESGAWVISYNNQLASCSEHAFPAYFGYKSSIFGVQRDDYDDSTWTAMVKMELNAGRPVIYVGYSDSDGHAFVADGYDANDFLHINWGWSGHYNGYFSINAMDPLSPLVYPDYMFDQHQEVLGGIEPANPSLAITLNDAVTAPATVFYHHPISITTKLANTGSLAFAGDYAARVFDLRGNVVDSIQVMTGNALSAGNHTGTLTFATAGSAALTPGVYQVGIYYRPAGRRWLEAGETANYINLQMFTVRDALDVPAAGNPVSLQVYPNPAADAVHLVIPGLNNAAQLRIQDVAGRELVVKDVQPQQRSVMVSTAGWASGVYFVRLQSAEGSAVQQLMIQR